MVAVPIPARSGEALGVVVLHTVAPHEFDAGVITFLRHTASLVAGAIENARSTPTPAGVSSGLTALSGLGQRIAAVIRREELLGRHRGRAAAARVRSAELYLLDAASGGLERAAADPHDGASLAATALLELLRGRRSAAPAGGAVSRPATRRSACSSSATASRRRRGGRAAAGGRQPARGRAREGGLIERLTAENLVRDLFACAGRRRHDVAEAGLGPPGFVSLLRHRGGASGDAARPERPWPAVAERAEARLRRSRPAALSTPARTYLLALPCPVRPARKRGPGGVSSALLGAGPRASRRLGVRLRACRRPRERARGGRGRRRSPGRSCAAAAAHSLSRSAPASTSSSSARRRPP